MFGVVRYFYQTRDPNGWWKLGIELLNLPCILLRETVTSLSA